MKQHRTVSRWMLALFVFAILPSSFSAQTPAKNDATTTLPVELGAASDLTATYGVKANIPYVTTDSGPERLDVYRHMKPGSYPTLLYIHGGGWRTGSKDQYSLWFEPFLLLGWNVVNIDYRLSNVARAPAAVEDSVCALRWVIHNAKQYGFDTSRIVVMGHSAGAHLALMTGMVPEEAGFDKNCPGPEPLKVTAIIDWFGVSDVADLLHEPNKRDYATQWIGDSPESQARAKQVSPLTYIREGLPPTIIIHGDKDPFVPYEQAVHLHDALVAAKVPTEFVTVPGGKHGNYGSGPTHDAYAHILDFLKRAGVGTEATR